MITMDRNNEIYETFLSKWMNETADEVRKI